MENNKNFGLSPGKMKFFGGGVNNHPFLTHECDLSCHGSKTKRAAEIPLLNLNHE